MKIESRCFDFHGIGWPAEVTIHPMAQGKRISVDIPEPVLHSIRELGAAARQARTAAGEGQAAVAARLGVHVQTIGRIEAGEPGVAIGHVLGLLALYGLGAKVQAGE